MKQNIQELEPFRTVLHSAGVRMTHQRIEIFLEMRRSHGHPSVAEIFEAVRRKMPSISLDTVYRTLKMFSDLGLINRLSSVGSSVRFDTNTDSHHHFFCTRCGRTADFNSMFLDDFEIPEEAHKLGTVKEVQIEVRGLCKECADKEQREGMVQK
jgi:Fur family transcriptional regulator, peroxide stress response regulator